MKINQPVTDTEIHFLDDEAITSTTDKKGVITGVSPAFIRLSGFSEEELLGKSHNIVRHPDMPTQAFSWLWDTVKSGKVWNGRVKNRCKNGDYYWVDAYVTPTFGEGCITGYNSLRLKPSRVQVDAADKLYADINAGRRRNPFKVNRVNIMLSKVKLWQKFAVLGLLAVLMFAMPVWQLLSRADDDITVATKESQGVAYTRNVLKLMQLVQQHRALATAVLSGDRSSVAQFESKRKEINAQINLIDETDARLASLALTDHWQEVRGQWQQLLADVPVLTLDSSIAKHGALVNALLRLNRRVADNSGLALDPEIDSYYLMLTTIHRMPELAENLGQLRSQGIVALQEKNLAAEQRATITISAEAVPKTISFITENMEKTQSRPLLSSDMKTLLDMVSAVSQVVADKVIHANTLDFPVTDYANVTTTAINQVFTVADKINTTLDDALNARIKRLASERLRLLVTALGLLAAFAVYSAYFARGLLVGIKAITESLGTLNRGKMPAHIEGNYGLELNQLKDGLNLAVSAVRTLIADTGLLAQAAVAGKLDTRADASRHLGDYRKIVEGVNATLDAVMNPLNVAANYVEQIAKGVIPEKITATYNGDFNTIKNNLNTCIDALNGLIQEMQQMSEQHELGDIDININEGRFQGSYQTMAKGVNDMVSSHIAVKKKAMGVVKAFGEGNFDAPMEQLPGKKAFINDTIELVRGNLQGFIADMQ
ncbi:MAG: PAS domain-containing protein, partial [Methylococcales bacterium]|nr:PAS domain-containing protein [Methylococcales bacterium]